MTDICDRIGTADVLRVLRVSEDEDMDDYAPPMNWRIEGRRLLTDSPRFFAKVLVRVDDVTTFPPDFVQALALKFAASLAPMVNGSEEMVAMLHNMYKAQKMRAETTDGKQGTPDRSSMDVQQRYPQTGFGTRAFRGFR